MVVYAQAALFLGFEHKVMPARDFYTELEPEMLREENPNLLILYLRNIPTVADVPAYQQQVAAHYKLADDKGKGRPVRTEILRTEICGEKTENRDGAVQFIFENSHNIKTYPVINMLLDGNKIGTFSAARRQISVKGMDLCPDASCAAMGNMHKMGCNQGQGARGAEAAGPRVRQVQKDFDELASAPTARRLKLSGSAVQAGRQGEVHELLQELQLQGRAVSGRVHPMAYPCCEWPEIMETELDGTFYTELPAFRWPKRRSKGPGKGAKRRGARCGALRATAPSTRRCEGVWRGAL